MRELHPLFQLLDKGEQASEAESLLAAAITTLSVQPRYSHLTLEQVYDEVVKHRDALRPLPTMEVGDS